MDGVLDLSRSKISAKCEELSTEKKSPLTDIGTRNVSVENQSSLVKPVPGPVPINNYGLVPHVPAAYLQNSWIQHAQRPFKLYPFVSPTPIVENIDKSPDPNQRKRKLAPKCEDDVESKISRVDDAYWNRRRKNNEAAKRSRETRRAKEEETKQRVAYLEQENLKLQAQVTLLKTENSKLHFMLYNNRPSAKDTQQ